MVYYTLHIQSISQVIHGHQLFFMDVVVIGSTWDCAIVILIRKGTGSIVAINYNCGLLILYYLMVLILLLLWYYSFVCHYLTYWAKKLNKSVAKSC